MPVLPVMVTGECSLPVCISTHEPFAIFFSPFHLSRGEKNGLDWTHCGQPGSVHQCAIMEAPIVFDKTCTASVQSRRQRNLSDLFSLTFLFKPHLFI